jgi:hypothetical protein
LIQPFASAQVFWSLISSFRKAQRAASPFDLEMVEYKDQRLCNLNTLKTQNGVAFFPHRYASAL